MTAWFDQFRHGDPENRDFQKRLIDTFVNSVYVFDDKLVLTYTYQHGAQTISLEEAESALGSDSRCGSPPRRSRRKWWLFAFSAVARRRLRGGVFGDGRAGDVYCWRA